MKVVVAPDSFKGSMSALAAAQAIAAGIRDVHPHAEIALVPLADGGEGTVDALVAAMPGSVTVDCWVHGPLGKNVKAKYGLLGERRDFAVVEMAAASGLPLVPAAKRDVLRSSSYGTGELIRAALRTPGLRRLIIGIGGSATNDGGAGALQAMGVSFRTEHGKGFGEMLTPLLLSGIRRVDCTDVPEFTAQIVIATDVTNPLLGATGASAVFGPQKGATPEMVEALDGILSLFAPVLDELAQQRDKRFNDPASCSVADRPGAGAAGGLGAGLLALFPGATLVPGIDLVLDTAGFDNLIADADLVITGEGKLDTQTLAGKTICGVLRRTSRAGVRTIALAGSVDRETASALQIKGLAAAYALTDYAADVPDAMARGPELLREVARRSLAQLG